LGIPRNLTGTGRDDTLEGRRGDDVLRGLGGGETVLGDGPEIVSEPAEGGAKWERVEVRRDVSS
jgi:hypothetical protein